MYFRFTVSSAKLVSDYCYCKNLLGFFSKQDSAYNKYQCLISNKIFSNFFVQSLSTSDEHCVNNSTDLKSIHRLHLKIDQSQMSQFSLCHCDDSKYFTIVTILVYEFVTIVRLSKQCQSFSHLPSFSCEK